MEKRRIGRGGLPPKNGQLALIGNAGNIIMRAANHFNRHIVNKRGKPAGAVERDHADAVAQKYGQRHIMHIKHPPFELRVLFYKMVDVFLIIDKAPVHRMVFHN